MKIIQPKPQNAKKFDKIKYAVVLKQGYDFATIENVDFETESSFGERGVTIKHVRTESSTGSRIKKADVSYRMFDTIEEAREFQKRIHCEFTVHIELLRGQINEQIHKMKKFVEGGKQTNLTYNEGC